MKQKPSNSFDDHPEEQGQLDLGRSLNPVQFRDTLPEQAIRRGFQAKFGRHGEGHWEDMYEHNLKWRRAQANNARPPR